MENNITLAVEILSYIETHLEERLDLSRIAAKAGYSAYHLHRILAGVTGLPIHAFIQRRRLTEAARKLVYSGQPVIQIGQEAGYETQQSFTVAFKSLLGTSPSAYRKKAVFVPLQLPFHYEPEKIRQGPWPLEVKIIEHGSRLLAGYKGDTAQGFSVIGQCFRKLHRTKAQLSGVLDVKLTMGLNDYSAQLPWTAAQPGFFFFAAQEIKSKSGMVKGMVYKELEAGRFAVFSFLGKTEDPVERYADYIYREWFPQSSCRFNENAMYDMVLYHEDRNEAGKSLIEYWIPIQ